MPNINWKAQIAQDILPKAVQITLWLRKGFILTGNNSLKNKGFRNHKPTCDSKAPKSGQLTALQTSKLRYDADKISTGIAHIHRFTTKTRSGIATSSGARFFCQFATHFQELAGVEQIPLCTYFGHPKLNFV